MCEPVAETLLDVRISKPSARPLVRAIAGLWVDQAVAVATNDSSDCGGPWLLAIDQGVTPEARAVIRAEVQRGVDAFGAIAAPIPKDPDNGMDR